jgi:hypothetical protein
MQNTQNIQITWNEAIELKARAKEQFSAEIHFHDCCGGQYFSLETSDEKLKSFIENYFANKSLKAVFSDDGLQFTVHRLK